MINLSIKKYIFSLFIFTVFAFLIMTLFIQYYTSNEIIEKSINKSLDNVSKNITARLQVLEHRVKNGIDLIDYYNDEEIKFKVKELHSSVKKIAILMRNNPFILASYYGYENGDFLEIINIDINKEANKIFSKNINEKWLIIKIFNNNGKPTRYEEYLDENFNLLREEIVANSNYNPTTRPWFKEAFNSNEIIRTEPYLFENVKSIGMTYAKRLENNSVFGVDISLKNLSSFFEDQIENSILFLLNEDDNELIATNNGLFNKYLDLISKNLNTSNKTIKLDKEEYYIAKNYINTEIGLNQILILLTPKNDAIKEFKENLDFGIIATILFFILTLPFVLYLINLLIKPISSLILENKKIIDKEYDKVSIVNTNLKELRSLSKSLVKLSRSVKEHEEKQDKFIDGFINTISGAIDDKSPYTGGHCHKIPIIMNLLVESASKSNNQEFAELKNLSKEQLREIDVGAKLHDCGKITTPEYVMDKAVKLETIYNRIHEIRTRFEVIYRDLKIKAFENYIKTEDKVIIEKRLQNEFKTLKDEFSFIANCNIGTEFMQDESIEKIKVIGQREWIRYFDDSLGLSNEEKSRYIKPNSNIEKLLDDKQSHIVKREFFDFAEFDRFGFKMEVPKNLYNYGEIYNLSIKKGTINTEERFKINEHIITTIKMLENLPFPKNLSKVAEYAGNHHETLIGTGYPRKLLKEQMSLPSRMMAIADIFEALTANDRPYKDAKKLSEVIKIMSFFVKDKHLDKSIFKLFIEEKIYLTYANKYLKEEQIDLEKLDEVISSLDL